MTVNSETGGLADPTLLEKIDKLFACNVGEYVALPQLVVVGDQSSGKSSVLETLTKLPFPRESTLCTRFATQITFRRSNRVSILVSIIPANDASDAHKAEAGSWKRGDIEGLDMESFASIMSEANKVMEFRTGSSGRPSQFSTDVLRLEITGPEQQHLSVIDVPGLFENPQEDVTTMADVALVKSMVYTYMSNPRSVMLAVVPANVDIATQGILQRAKEIDPDGIRTLGVLTKPDLAPEGTEHNVVNTVMGRNNKLKLGWHVLRNAGQLQLTHSIERRHAEEKEFFSTKPPWDTIDKNRVGVDAFRSRLRDVLGDHVQHEFPKVKAEIVKKLSECKRNLQVLGAKRQTQSEQIKYLTNIAMAFQKITQEALAANYGKSSAFQSNTNLRLVTEAVNRADTMSKMLSKKGHTYHYSPQDSQEDDIVKIQALPADTIPVSIMDVHPDIEDLSAPAFDDIVDPKESCNLDWLKEIYRVSRGFELGTFNSTLLATIMKVQASKWRDIAFGYITDIMSLTHRFVGNLLREVCPIQRVQDGIMSLLTDHLSAKYERAIEHVSFLLAIELDGTPATLNHYFNDTLQKRRVDKMTKKMAELSFRDRENRQLVKVEDLKHHHQNMSNAEHTVEEIYDILQSYYQVALKRFADNLRMQAADWFLISGPDTPLTLFSPAFVADLSEEQLKRAAEEDRQVRSQRDALEKEEHDLEEAKKIIRT